MTTTAEHTTTLDDRQPKKSRARVLQDAADLAIQSGQRLEDDITEQVLDNPHTD